MPIEKTIKNWWIFLITGILFISLSVLFFFQPVSSLMSINIFLALILMVAGVMELLFTVSNTKTFKNWSRTLLLGLLDFICGVVLLSHPEVTVITLPFIIGLWVIVKAIIMFASAVEKYSSSLKGGWWEILGGALLLIFGFLILFHPTLGIFTIALWGGIGFLLAGVGNIFTAIELKQIKNLFIE